MSAALRDHHPNSRADRPSTRGTAGRTARCAGALLALSVVIAGCGTGTGRSGTTAGDGSGQLTCGTDGPELRAFRDNLVTFSGDAHRYGRDVAAARVWPRLAEACT